MQAPCRVISINLGIWDFLFKKVNFFYLNIYNFWIKFIFRHAGRNITYNYSQGSAEVFIINPNKERYSLNMTTYQLIIVMILEVNRGSIKFE